jgi:hypothetical protein
MVDDVGRLEPGGFDGTSEPLDELDVELGGVERVASQRKVDGSTHG